MKVIDKLVDIANNGTSEIVQYFRYYNRNAKQFDSCMLSLENLIYKLNNGELDINDEIRVIDEEIQVLSRWCPPKEDEIEDTPNYIFKHYPYKEDKRIEKIPYQFSLNYIKSNIDDESKKGINKAINEIYDKLNEIIDKINGDNNE